MFRYCIDNINKDSSFLLEYEIVNQKLTYIKCIIDLYENNIEEDYRNSESFVSAVILTKPNCSIIKHIQGIYTKNNASSDILPRYIIDQFCDNIVSQQYLDKKIIIDVSDEYQVHIIVDKMFYNLSHSYIKNTEILNILYENAAVKYKMYIPNASSIDNMQNRFFKSLGEAS